MRGFDCSDPAHGKVHFTGKDDKDLVQIRADWWKELATSGANAGSAQSAYDE